ncbi:caprin-2 [Elysia marginata]|uniref:Caprin-2 n=1 Tax=Elysia marginata TaxID=1093978 RepID=A0AAV4IMT0_9GAST|nr:caprin-2 [Elysia marginata]
MANHPSAGRWWFRSNIVLIFVTFLAFNQHSMISVSASTIRVQQNGSHTAITGGEDAQQARSYTAATDVKDAHINRSYTADTAVEYVQQNRSFTRDTGMENLEVLSSPGHMEETVLTRLALQDTTNSTETKSRSKQNFITVEPRATPRNVKINEWTSAEKDTSKAVATLTDNNNANVSEVAMRDRGNKSYNTTKDYLFKETLASHRRNIEHRNVFKNISEADPISGKEKTLGETTESKINVLFTYLNVRSANETLEEEQDVFYKPIPNYEMKKNETGLDMPLNPMIIRNKMKIESNRAVFSSSTNNTNYFSFRNQSINLALSAEANQTFDPEKSLTSSRVNQTEDMLKLAPPISSLSALSKERSHGTSKDNVPAPSTSDKSLISPMIIPRDGPRDSSLLTTPESQNEISETNRSTLSVSKGLADRRSKGVQDGALLSAPASQERKFHGVSETLKTSNSSVTFHTQTKAPAHVVHNQQAGIGNHTSKGMKDLNQIKPNNGTSEIVGHLPNSFSTVDHTEHQIKHYGLSEGSRRSFPPHFQTKTPSHVEAPTSPQRAFSNISATLGHLTSKDTSSTHFIEIESEQRGFKPFSINNKVPTFNDDIQITQNPKTGDKISDPPTEAVADTTELSKAIEELIKALESSRNQESDTPQFPQQSLVFRTNVSQNEYGEKNTSSIFDQSSAETNIQSLFNDQGGNVKVRERGTPGSEVESDIQKHRVTRDNTNSDTEVLVEDIVKNGTVYALSGEGSVQPKGVFRGTSNATSKPGLQIGEKEREENFLKNNGLRDPKDLLQQTGFDLRQFPQNVSKGETWPIPIGSYFQLSESNNPNFDAPEMSEPLVQQQNSFLPKSLTTPVSPTPATAPTQSRSPLDGVSAHSSFKAPDSVNTTVLSQHRPLASRLLAVAHLTAGREFEGKDSVIARLDAIAREIMKKINLTQAIDPELGIYKSWTEPRHDLETTMAGLSSEVSKDTAREIDMLDESVNILLGPAFSMTNLTDDIENNKKLLDWMSQRVSRPIEDNSSNRSATPFMSSSLGQIKVSKAQQIEEESSRESIETERVNRDLKPPSKSVRQKEQAKNRKQLKYISGYGLRSTSDLAETQVNPHGTQTKAIEGTPDFIEEQVGLKDVSGSKDKEKPRTLNTAEHMISMDKTRGQKSNKISEIPEHSGNQLSSDELFLKDETAVIGNSQRRSHMIPPGVTSLDSRSRSNDFRPDGQLAVNDMRGSVDDKHKYHWPSSLYQDYFFETFKPIFNKKKEYTSNYNIRPYHTSDTNFDDTLVAGRLNGGRIKKTYGTDKERLGSVAIDENSFLNRYTEWQELLSHNLGFNMATSTEEQPFASSRDIVNRRRMLEPNLTPLIGNISPNNYYRPNFPETDIPSEHNVLAPDIQSYGGSLSYQGGQLVGHNPPSFVGDNSEFYEEYEPMERGFDEGEINYFNDINPPSKRSRGYEERFKLPNEKMYPSFDRKLNSVSNNFIEYDEHLKDGKSHINPLEFSNENELPRLIKAETLTNEQQLPVGSRFDSNLEKDKFFENPNTPEHKTFGARKTVVPDYSSDLHSLEHSRSVIQTEKSQGFDVPATNSLPSHRRSDSDKLDLPKEMNEAFVQNSQNASSLARLLESDTELGANKEYQPITHKGETLFNRTVDENYNTTAPNSFTQENLDLYQNNNTESFSAYIEPTDSRIFGKDFIPANKSQPTAPSISFHRKESKAKSFSSPILSIPDALGDNRLNEISKSQVTSLSQTSDRSGLSLSSSNLIDVSDINLHLEGDTSDELPLNTIYKTEKPVGVSEFHRDGETESESESIGRVREDYFSQSDVDHRFLSTENSSTEPHWSMSNATVGNVSSYRAEPKDVPEITAYKAQDFSLRQPSVLDNTNSKTEAPGTSGKSSNSVPTTTPDNNINNDNNDTLSSLSDSISNLTSLLASGDSSHLQPLLSPLPVFPSLRTRAAMSAVLTTHFGPTKDRMIPFDLELLDLGDNYDNTSGTFICTAPGTYVISLHLMAHPGAKVNARVHVNSRPIAALWADDNGGAGFYPSSSTHTLTHLDFGDQVYVMLVDAGYGDSWVHANYNGFSVYLLYEDLPTF